MPGPGSCLPTLRPRPDVLRSQLCPRGQAAQPKGSPPPVSGDRPRTGDACGSQPQISSSLRPRDGSGFTTAEHGQQPARAGPSIGRDRVSACNCLPPLWPRRLQLRPSRTNATVAQALKRRSFSDTDSTATRISSESRAFRPSLTHGVTLKEVTLSAGGATAAIGYFIQSKGSAQAPTFSDLVAAETAFREEVARYKT